ncbi:MAG: SIMPL domain-containing protein [Patescibacteria group bacterium]
MKRSLHKEESVDETCAGPCACAGGGWAIQSYHPRKTAVMIALAFAALAFGFHQFVQGFKELSKTDPPRQLFVNGEGKTLVRPDIAVFTAGVVTQSERLKDAQLEHTRRSNAVIAFIKGRGIADKDIKTTHYALTPQYQYGNGRPCYQFPCPSQTPPRIVGYEVRSGVEVRVRKLDDADDLLEGVVTNGANEVSNLNFTVDNEENVRRQARDNAIKDAQMKARILAKDLGVRLGDIVSFSESGGGGPIFARAMLKGEGMGGDVATPTPAIEPGEQEIRSFVTIIYEFR